MRRLIVLVASLALLSAVALPLPVLHTAAQTGCGVERWPVKVLADDDAAGVNLTPVPETVADLVAFPTPDTLPQHNRIAPVEFTTYTLSVNLVEAKVEDDSDIHLVVADPQTGDTMIAELPDAADCALTTDPTLAAEMQAARDSFVSLFGLPSRERFTPELGTATVTGVGFFDFLHGQRGVAPNGIELHPVLDFEEQPAAAVAPAPPSPAPAPVSAPPPATTSSHTWYTSSASNATTYYCDDDPEWQTLSTRNLRSFSTVTALLAVYPSKHLHRPCRDGATGP